MFRPEATKVAYMRLIEVLDSIGPFVIEEKKTSLHFLAGRFAFLGAEPRPGGIRINLVMSRRLQGYRIHKSEQVSGITFHNEVDVNIPQDFNEELVGWIREAYALRAKSKPAPLAAATPAPAAPSKKETKTKKATTSRKTTTTKTTKKAASKKRSA